MPSRPPIRPPERPFGDVTRRWRRGRLKIEPVNVSQPLQVEMTYLGRANATQPPGYPSKHACRVIGPRHRRGHIKIEPVKVKIEHVNDKSAQEVEMTYRICARAVQPPVNAPDRRYRVHRTIRQRGHIKLGPTNVSRMAKVEMTHLGRIHIAQPPEFPTKCSIRVVGPSHRCIRIKIGPVKLKIKRMSDKTTPEDGNTYRIRASATQPLPNDSKRLYTVIGPHCQCQRIKLVPANVNRTQSGRNA